MPQYEWMSEKNMNVPEYVWIYYDRAVLHPDVFWHYLNGTGAQKNMPRKVLVTLFTCTFP